MINLNEQKSLQLQLVDEVEFVKGKIEIQEKNKNLCNIYMMKISDYINHVNPGSIEKQSQFENTIRELKSICDNVILNLEDLNTLKEFLFELDKMQRNDLIAVLPKYNEAYTQVFQRIDKHDAILQGFTTSVLQNYTFVFASNDIPLQEITSNVTSNKVVSNSLDNNSLIVSEKDQVAYLPYRMDDVENLLKLKRRSKQKYSSIDDVIHKVFVVPLILFKFPTIARFREVFNLVRKESNLLESFETAVELMTNFNLDPVVVRSCRDVQELNIFLDCLEEQETDKFPCFSIKYEVAPIVKKQRKNTEFFVTE